MQLGAVEGGATALDPAGEGRLAVTWRCYRSEWAFRGDDGWAQGSLMWRAGYLEQLHNALQLGRGVGQEEQGRNRGCVDGRQQCSVE